MTKILLALFILAPNQVTAQFFNVRTSEIKTETSVTSAANLKQEIFCLQKDGTLFKIDTSAKEVYKQPVTVHTLTELYSERDTLFGVAGKDSLYYFDGSDFRYHGRKKENRPLYSDTAYEVTSTCSGEWGGTVYFINRKTGKKFACSATCPIMINRTDTSYIVTASLAHLMGSTEILEIPSPDQMQVYNYKPSKRRVKYAGENESTSRQGVKVLIDSMRVFTIGSYPIEGEILHVVTNFDQTYICRIRNGAFEVIQQLAESSFWSYRNQGWCSKDGVGWNFFLNNKDNGLIRIAGRSIQIYLFKYTKSIEE